LFLEAALVLIWEVVPPAEMLFPDMAEFPLVRLELRFLELIVEEVLFSTCF